MSLNILIISSYFPPVPGVGGRRWAKFVKYLSRKKEVNVHVISAKNTVENVKSSFADELKNVNFKHTQLPSNYPKYLEFLEFWKPTLFRKVMFRVQLFSLKRRVEGNYWDFSVLWESHFKKTIPNIIRKEKITKLIVSGPPYRYIKFAYGLKAEFPDLELILDYRDPWNDFNDPFPITEDRHEYERALEKEMLQKVDKIITVSAFQKSLIQKNQPNSAPVYLVPNGFDHEDYQSNIRQKEPSDKIKLVHFGTLHYLKDYYWVPFFNAYARLKNEEPEIYEQLEISLVGYCPEQVSSFITELDLDVKIHGMLEPFVAYGELNQADVALWFKYDGSPGDFATKFGDYISINKFMWTFSVKGAVTDHIEEHNIGKVFYRDDAALEATIYNAFLNVKKTENRIFNPNYDASALQIVNLTDQLLDVLAK
ncbi:MAG: glycosyltransferase involved in cell wall biosynthesis [Crocinitomix sp.]|jgi:glycosyltransferase involved in cell wall biosynthesis